MRIIQLVLAPVVFAACGSAWCPLCPDEERGTSGAPPGSAGGAGGGGPVLAACPASINDSSARCSGSPLICVAHVSESDVIGCVCRGELAQPVWQCELVSCPDAMEAGSPCSVFLLGHDCPGRAASCLCSWNNAAGASEWVC
jgi:hypothetical protein